MGTDTVVSMVSKLLITNISIISMTNDDILHYYDILIEDTKIVEISSTGHILHEDAEIIDGTGKYVIPGLSDMHVHIWEEDLFPMYLANGVTTVRNMWGNPVHLGWRHLTKEDPAFLCPRIFTVNPLADGSPPIWNRSYVVATDEDAKSCVDDAISRGYDQIKVYNKLTKEAYTSLIKYAKGRIKITGHIPNEVGLEQALSSQQYCIEHLQGYQVASMSDPDALKKYRDLPDEEFKKTFIERCNLMIDTFDQETETRLIEKTVANGVWNCPTLVVNSRIARPSRTAEFLR